jgi:23S rRNA (adenine2503-C2)-methyltransferase
MKNIKDYNISELKEKLARLNEKAYRAEQIFKWIYKENVSSFDEMTDLSKSLREKLKNEYSLSNFNILEKQVSKDRNSKILI